MNLADLKVGDVVAYYPPKADKHDNRHPKATVVAIAGKRVTIETGSPLTDGGGGLRRTVSPRSLAFQADLLP